MSPANHPLISQISLLTILLLLPLISAFVIGLAPEKMARQIAIVSSFIMFLLSLVIWAAFKQHVPGLQLEQKLLWITQPFPVEYHVGMDGINLCLTLLTTFIVMMSILASTSIKMRPKLYYSLVMLLTLSLLGVFLSMDLLQFFVFYELELIPMYFLIAIWGGPRKDYAAMKFLLYTFLGGIFMLAAIIFTYTRLLHDDPTTTLNMIALAQRCPLLPKFTQAFAFFGFFIAFIIKLPSFPVHTWLPDAHVEAPTPISMILAGLLLKMGSYGLVRICLTFFPNAIAEYGPFIMWLGAFNIVWAAVACLVQKDMKRIIAFSSVSHMGFVLLGIGAISSLALQGAIFQMVSHGIISALLFFLVGAVYERCHTRDIKEIGGGLAKHMPVLFYFWMFACLANLGLPGLSGFVAETAVYYGSYTSLMATALHSASTQPAVIFATLGVVLTAGYMLWLLKRLFFGPEGKSWGDHLADATQSEKIIAATLSTAVVVLGIFPLLMSSQFTNSANLLVSLISSRINFPPTTGTIINHPGGI